MGFLDGSIRTVPITHLHLFFQFVVFLLKLFQRVFQSNISGSDVLVTLVEERAPSFGSLVQRGKLVDARFTLRRFGFCTLDLSRKSLGTPLCLASFTLGFQCAGSESLAFTTKLLILLLLGPELLSVSGKSSCSRRGRGEPRAFVSAISVEVHL